MGRAAPGVGRGPIRVPFGDHSQSLYPLAVVEAIELLDEVTMNASTLRTVRRWAFEYRRLGKCTDSLSGNR